MGPIILKNKYSNIKIKKPIPIATHKVMKIDSPIEGINLERNSPSKYINTPTIEIVKHNNQNFLLFINSVTECFILEIWSTLDKVRLKSSGVGFFINFKLW